LKALGQSKLQIGYSNGNIKTKVLVLKGARGEKGMEVCYVPRNMVKDWFSIKVGVTAGTIFQKWVMNPRKIPSSIGITSIGVQVYEYGR